MSASRGVDIVLPVYNEGGNIERALQAIQREVKVPYQVHIVYDFDADNTLPPAKAYAQKTGLALQLVKNEIGRGVLNAVKTGLRVGNFPYVVVTMADLSDPPAVINSMFEQAEKLQADVVCASRYMRGGSQEGGPFLKSLLSRLAGLSAHVLLRLPTHDLTNNFKLYSRRLLSEVSIESTGGFEIGMEIVLKAHAKGYKISEVPTHWVERDSGESQFRLWKWLPKYLRWYFYGVRRLLFGQTG